MFTELDCLGDMCPVPVMRLRQCKNMKNSGDNVKLITDHSCVLNSITDFCKQHQLLLEIVEPMSGVWELLITKP